MVFPHWAPCGAKFANPPRCRFRNPPRCRDFCDYFAFVAYAIFRLLVVGNAGVYRTFRSVVVIWRAGVIFRVPRVIFRVPMFQSVPRVYPHSLYPHSLSYIHLHWTLVAFCKLISGKVSHEFIAFFLTRYLAPGAISEFDRLSIRLKHMAVYQFNQCMMRGKSSGCEGSNR